MRRIAALLLPLALTACVGPYYGRGYPGGGRYERDRWDDYAGLPLAARLTQTGGSLGVRLNRPAYVAIFEIVPGRGVGLMYPSYSRERSYLPSGFSYLNMTAPRYYDWYQTSARGRYLSGEPRYYFLVASRRPLRISRFQRSPGALRSVLGLNAYSALNYHTVMNDLVYAIVPPQPDDEWTTDLLAIYPDRFYDRYAYGDYYEDRYVRVRCRDGSIHIVPRELILYACRDGAPANVVPPLRPTDPEGRDSAVTKPGRRRPLPPTAGGAGETGGSGRISAPGRRPGTPEEAGGGEGTRLRPEGGGGEPRAAQPRRLPPRLEPQREEPGASEPRRDPPKVREEPRRVEPPQRAREEPRETPRHEPREAPRRAEPRNDPPPRSEPVRHEPPPRAEPVRSDPPPRNDPPPRSDPPRADPPSDSRPSPVRPSRDPSEG